MQYRIDHIPLRAGKRPGYQLDARSITVHNTANLKSTAKNERQWLENPTNYRTASWHIVIDEKEGIEAIPLNEVAWHAGYRANNSSIGIELCESGNWQKTRRNGIELIATMLVKRNWDISHVKKHQDWTGKDCPRKLIPEWKQFLAEIQIEVQKLLEIKGKE